MHPTFSVKPVQETSRAPVGAIPHLARRQNGIVERFGHAGVQNDGCHPGILVPAAGHLLAYCLLQRLRTSVHKCHC
jgi:hypothetical protein